MTKASLNARRAWHHITLNAIKINLLNILSLISVIHVLITRLKKSIVNTNFCLLMWKRRLFMLERFLNAIHIWCLSFQTISSLEIINRIPYRHRPITKPQLRMKMINLTSITIIPLMVLLFLKKLEFKQIFFK